MAGEVPAQEENDRWSPSRLQAGPLVELGVWLRAQGYRFVTTTPDTHARVRARSRRERPTTLRDIFGWNRSFGAAELPAQVLDWLRAGNACELIGAVWRSRVRYSSLGDMLLLHSAYPTQSADAVFFGPDTYRFARLIRESLRTPAFTKQVPRVLDVGCGTGVGGLLAAQLLHEQKPQLTLADISPAALRCAEINCAVQSIAARLALSDGLAGTPGQYELILCNPPYLQDAAGRIYRHGGGHHGCELALRIVREALDRLSPGGRLLLYSGAAVIDGEDQFFARLEPLLFGRRYRYEEIDPDVFGEELERPAYAQVERIAAVGLVIEQGGDST